MAVWVSSVSLNAFDLPPANPYSILAGPGGEGLGTLGSLVGRLVRAARSVLLQWLPGENLTVLGGSGLQVNRRLKGARTHKVATA